MFLLDSNVFIQAARLYYHPDIAPTFWRWLAEQHQQGALASIVAVRKELDDGDKRQGPGHLKTWAASLPASFWLKPDASTTPSMTQLSAWVMHPDRKYTQAAKDEFLRVADYYLVAQAQSGQHHVVTFELPSPDSKKRVLIPDACNALGVPFAEPFSVYRDLGLRFL
ncbi:MULTISPECIES: DUF4411 family protein [unclassified Luteococcus]|uniref:DUF4411 family protein n=1 Tax=unclassified Luteococcus TaxID=2639923 RepID=UPI00313D8FC7